MKTQELLQVSISVIELNLKLFGMWQQGGDASSCKKHIKLHATLSKRLLTALRSREAELTGTTPILTPDNRASGVRKPRVKRA